MHVVCVSYYYDRDLTEADALLERYRTLTDWADGLSAAGACVSVVQRFGCDLRMTRADVAYHFVRHPARRFGGPLDTARRVNERVVALRPDVIHVHGLHFVRQAARLKRLAARTPILVQDHAGAPPEGLPARWSRRQAMRHIDAVSFTVPEQATVWRDAGILDERATLVELAESSSRFRLMPREEARRCTGLQGDPLCLFVGRLNANKDPLTVLEGFAKAIDRMPGARLAMVYGEEHLLPALRARLERSPEVAARVMLLGRRPHAAMEAIYNSADLFLLGSDYDGGSGYSVLEALSCGVVPVITDLPSFRAVTAGGTFGGHWPPGDSDALASTLLAWSARLEPRMRQRIRDHFEARHGPAVVGQRALEAYARLIAGGAA
jgi:glycosyltransferase involved in cell wall biosynthesis